MKKSIITLSLISILSVLSGCKSHNNRDPASASSKQEEARTQDVTQHHDTGVSGGGSAR